MSTRRFRLGAQGRQSIEYFGVKGISDGGLRWMTSKVGETIIGYKLRVGMTSLPQIDTGGIEFRIVSGEILLDSREEVRRRKEGVCQEYTGVKGIPFEMGYFLTPVSLLQVYFGITSWTSQGLYLLWAVFLQRLILTPLS